MITFRPIGIFISVPDPDPTVNIPAYTIRIRLINGGNPPSSQAGATVSQPFPSIFPNIYDYTLNSSDWNHILAGVGTPYFEIVGINSTGVENMNRMFDLSGGLHGSIPLFDTSSATDVENMFYECYNVTGGMYALYNQMANQTNPPYSHSGCFQNCGVNTATGQAELAQIPNDWGGNQSSGAAYNYRVMFASNNPTLYLNTICMDRTQEGVGSCYSDENCNVYLSDLSEWNSGTSDTALMYTTFDGNYYIYDVYVKDVTVNSGSYGTIIAGQSDYEWSILYVFDNNGNMIGGGGTPSSPGEWVDFSNGS